MADPKFTINIHMDEGVPIKSSRVSSSPIDFVSLGIGWQASVFLFNSKQAKDFIEAATQAYVTLKGIEAEEEARQMSLAMNTRAQEAIDWDAECSTENPCPGCREYEEDYVPEYPDWDDRF